MSHLFCIVVNKDETYLKNMQNGEIRRIDDDELYGVLKSTVVLVSRYCEPVDVIPVDNTVCDCDCCNFLLKDKFNDKTRQ